MIALRIEDIRQFTAKLFVGETFDHFLIKEAEIVTFNVFTIDGHIRQGYYSEEELEENQMEELSSWKMIRPYCFSLIKGKKLPGSFQIVLQMPPQAVDKFVTGHQMPLKADQVKLPVFAISIHSLLFAVYFSMVCHGFSLFACKEYFNTPFSKCQ